MGNLDLRWVGECTSLPPSAMNLYIRRRHRRRSSVSRSLFGVGPSASLVLLPSFLPLSTELLLRRGGISVLARSLPSLSPFPVGEKEALRIPLERLPLIQLAPRLRGGRRKHLRDLYPPESGRRTRGCARESGRPRPSVGRSLRRDRRSRSPQRARWQRRHSQCFLARDPLARGTRLCWDIGGNGRKPSKISTSIKASLSNTTMMKT